MKKFSVRCFGTGDGWPCARRNHSSFLYRLGETSLLFDCGEPISRSYKATGLSYDTLDSIFLSHLHSDHAGGFFMLMQGFWLEDRKRDLPVYMPGKAIQPLRQMLETMFIFDEVLPFRLELKPLTPGKPHRVNDVQVTAFRTSHLDGFRKMFEKKYPVDFNAHCFLIESGKRRVGHSADLGRPEDLAPLLAKPLDFLICEVAHFSPEDLFGYLRGHRIKHAVFVHLARPYWKSFSKTRRLAARMLPDIPHTFARDQQEITF